MVYLERCFPVSKGNTHGILSWVIDGTQDGSHGVSSCVCFFVYFLSMAIQFGFNIQGKSFLLSGKKDNQCPDWVTQYMYLLVQQVSASDSSTVWKTIIKRRPPCTDEPHLLNQLNNFYWDWGDRWPIRCLRSITYPPVTALIFTLHKLLYFLWCICEVDQIWSATVMTQSTTKRFNN